MRMIKLIPLLAIIVFTSVQAQNYSISRHVIASGGGEMASTNYSANGTIGQATVGAASSDNYSINSGYWAGSGSGTGGGCDYVVGDVNNSGGYNGLDITYGVAYLKGGNPPICDPCLLCPDWYYCGDVNASCGYNGLDITYGVSYLKGGAAPLPCADCPPGGVIVAELSGSFIPTIKNAEKIKPGKTEILNPPIIPSEKEKQVFK